MPKKHHAIYSDPTGAAAGASSEKRRAPRAKRAPLSVDGKETSTLASASERADTQQQIVDRDAIARLAYSYWEARGFVGGSPEEDWLRAESEIRNNHAASAVA